MRTVPSLVLLLLLLLGPLTVACYPPRTDVCRDGETSSEGITELEISDIDNYPGFEYANPVSFTLRARSTRAISCVSVHSEVWRDGNLIDVVDTPVAATTNGTVLDTTRIYHYHAPVGGRGMELRVHVLGSDLIAEIPVYSPTGDAGTDGGFSPDASGSDAGASDAGAADAGAADAGASDADAGPTPDAG